MKKSAKNAKTNTKTNANSNNNSKKFLPWIIGICCILGCMALRNVSESTVSSSVSSVDENSSDSDNFRDELWGEDSSDDNSESSGNNSTSNEFFQPPADDSTKTPITVPPVEDDQTTTQSTTKTPDTAPPVANNTTTQIITEAPTSEPSLGNMTVHFIDVGQGDSTFIELPDGKTMLIDAGERDKGDIVTTYIYSLGYDTLDYVIASHAHSDHIGGLPDVISSFNVNNFYLTAMAADTKIYEDMLIAVDNSGAKTRVVTAGDYIINESSLSAFVAAPVSLTNENQNNNSIVLKLTYGENVFLFTGDAEKEEEDSTRSNIKCDVIKVGHHGSTTSSSSNFLKKTEPTYGVISCGMGNSYGHPTQTILDRYKNAGIKLFRTDLQGTIIFTSDGKNLTANVSPTNNFTPGAVTSQTTTQKPAQATQKPAVTTTIQQTDPPTEGGTTYVLNTSSKKIHFADCSSVDRMSEKNKAYTNDYEGAIAQGYTPCQNCNP